MLVFILNIHSTLETTVLTNVTGCKELENIIIQEVVGQDLQVRRIRN